MSIVNPDLNDEQEARIRNELGMAAKRVHAKFILSPELDHQRSAECGRPIYVDHPYIIEINEGEADYMGRRAKAAAKRHRPLRGERFQKACANPVHSVECIPGIKPSEISMLKESGVLTIQACAQMEAPPELADVAMKAKRWLAIAAGEKPRIKLEAVA